MPLRRLLCLFAIVQLFITVDLNGQNTIRIYKADNMFRNRELKDGSQVTIRLKGHRGNISGVVEQITLGSFAIRTPADTAFTIYPDSIEWISAGRDRWIVRTLGSLGPKLIAAGGVYFAFGMINGYLLGYSAKSILRGRIITGGIISASGLVVTGVYYLMRGKRMKMGPWKMRINDFGKL